MREPQDLRAREPAELTGPRVFGYLGADDATRVPDDEQDRLALAVAGALGVTGP